MDYRLDGRLCPLSIIQALPAIEDPLAPHSTGAPGADFSHVYHRPAFIGCEYSDVQEQRRKTAHGYPAGGNVGGPAAIYDSNRTLCCLWLRADFDWMDCSGVLYAGIFSSFICLCRSEASGFGDSLDLAARVAIRAGFTGIPGCGSDPDLFDF